MIKKKNVSKTNFFPVEFLESIFKKIAEIKKTEIAFGKINEKYNICINSKPVCHVGRDIVQLSIVGNYLVVAIKTKTPLSELEEIRAIPMEKIETLHVEFSFRESKKNGKTVRTGKIYYEKGADYVVFKQEANF